MPYDYPTYVAELANLVQIEPPTDPNYQQVLPNIIDDAEQRIYRELDLLNTILVNQAGSFVPNSRSFTFPTHFVVSESINVFSNFGSNPPTGRRQMIPVSREFLDAVYPDDQACGCCGESVPHYYAMITDQTIIVGPPPDQAYVAEVIGTIRPVPFSATNPTTYLTQYLPDLFLAESAIFAYMYMKDAGATADDPRSSATWSQHYQELLQSAIIEEGRKKYASQAWTPKQPSQIATPARQ